MRTKPTAKQIGVLLVLCLISSCEKSPKTTKPDEQSFSGEVYRSADDRNVLTLISGDELELSVGNTTILCKYSKEDEALRVIMRGNDVVYFRFTDYGLQDSRGTAFLSPKSYATAKEQALVAQQDERMRQQRFEENQRRAEEERHKEILAMLDEGMEIVRSFFTKGAVIKSYYMPNIMENPTPFQVTVTGDVSFSTDKSDVFQVRHFIVPAHMKWLGPSGSFERFTASGFDSDMEENDGQFVGQVLVYSPNNNDQHELKVSVSFGVFDTALNEVTTAGNQSIWDGKEFSAGEAGSSNRFFRQAKYKSEGASAEGASAEGVTPSIPGPQAAGKPLGRESNFQAVTEEADVAFQAANEYLTEAGPPFQAILDGVDKDGLEAVRATNGEEAARIAELFSKAAEQLRLAADKATEAAAKKPGEKLEAFLAAKADAYRCFADAREINREIALMIVDPSIKTGEELVPKVLEAAGRRDALEAEANKAIERADAMVK